MLLLPNVLMLQVYTTIPHPLLLFKNNFSSDRYDKDRQTTFFLKFHSWGGEALVDTKKIHMNTVYQFIACSDFICIPPLYLQILHLF